MMADHDSQFAEAQTVSVSVESPGLSDELLDLDAHQAITLYQVGRMVTASRDLEATLEAITEATHQLIGSDTTALALIEDDGRLVMRAAVAALTRVSASPSTSTTA